MYDGGTTLEDAANAVHASATISMQEYCTEKTLPMVAEHGHQVAAFNHPISVKATDKFLMTVAKFRRRGNPGVAGKGARPSGGRHRRLRPRTSTGRSSRSTAIPTCATASPNS